MMEYTGTPGVQGICPAGWHIPTFAEWCTLLTFLDSTYYCAADNAWHEDWALGAKLMESGTAHWMINENNNASGFTALGAGDRTPNGDFGYPTVYTTLRPLPAIPRPRAPGFRLVHYDQAIMGGHDDKNFGLSVRCLKD